VLPYPVEGDVSDFFPTLLVADDVGAVGEGLEVDDPCPRGRLDFLLDQPLRDEVVGVARDDQQRRVRSGEDDVALRGERAAGDLRLSGTTYVSHAMLLSATLIVWQNVYWNR
jgi:hypothetical protein